MFSIICYQTHQGQFANYIGLDLGNGLRLQPIYNDIALVLTVVPEPSTLLILVSAGLFTIPVGVRRFGLLPKN